MTRKKMKDLQKERQQQTLEKVTTPPIQHSNGLHLLSESQEDISAKDLAAQKEKPNFCISL